MATIEQVKAQIQSLIDASNEKTGQASADLTSAVNVLIEGFGTGGGSTEVDILAEQEIIAEYVSDVGYSMIQVDGLLGLEVGETYNVIFDGVEHTLTCELVMGAPFMGNLAFASGEDNGLPFGILDFPSSLSGSTDMWTIMTSDTETTTHTIRIYQVKSGGSADSDLVKWVTFMSEDGSTELYKMPVLNGDTSKNPITTGAIETPTKESTPQYNYSYSGWALEQGGTASSYALVSVTEDRTVYVSFTSAVRYYTVRLYDDDKTTLFKSVSLAYGSSYTDKPEKLGYKFVGWNPEPTNITGNLDCYAVWVLDDGIIRDSWETIVQYANDGTISSMYKVGDVKVMDVTYPNGTVEEIPMRIVDFESSNDYVFGTRNKAKVTFVADKLLKDIYVMDPIHPTKDYWKGSGLYGHLNTQVITYLPNAVQENIKEVTSSSDGGTTNMKSYKGKLWVCGMKEMWDYKITESNTSYSANCSGVAVYSEFAEEASTDGVTAIGKISPNVRKYQTIGGEGKQLRWFRDINWFNASKPRVHTGGYYPEVNNEVSNILAFSSLYGSQATFYPLANGAYILLGFCL